MTTSDDESHINKILAGAKIPPAPHVLNRLHRELQKDEPVLSEMANILAQDVGLSALVLRSVNSPFFGLRTKAKSIQHATSLLGMRNVVNIVAGLALRRAFDENGGANPPNYWDSPFNVAMAATSVARAVRFPNPDEAYMLGLFHNAGHLLLVRYFEDYRAFMTAHINDTDQLFATQEDNRYNTNHAVLGYFLARAWGLDKKVANVIRDHHSIQERFSMKRIAAEEELSLLAILKIAEHIDKLFWGYQPDHEWLSIQDQVLDYIGLSEQDFNDLQQDINDNLIGGSGY